MDNRQKEMLNIFNNYKPESHIEILLKDIAIKVCKDDKTFNKYFKGVKNGNNR